MLFYKGFSFRYALVTAYYTYPGLSVTCVPKVPIWKALDFNGLR
jgi:hypothetical protein